MFIIITKINDYKE